MLGQLHDQHANVVVVRLRRNFGKAAALQAGFLEARGDIDRDHRRRPAGRPVRDPRPARQARRGLRPRLRLEDAAQRPVPPAALLPRVQLDDRADLRRAPPRRQLRPQGVSRRGARGHAPVRRAPPVHPGARLVPGLPGRGDPREPPRTPARPLPLRAGAVPARLLRPAQRHVHGALPLPPAAPVRRDRRSSWARSDSSSCSTSRC